jgi:hypothetical protein
MKDAKKPTIHEEIESKRAADATAAELATRKVVAELLAIPDAIRCRVWQAAGSLLGYQLR